MPHCLSLVLMLSHIHAIVARLCGIGRGVKLPESLAQIQGMTRTGPIMSYLYTVNDTKHKSLQSVLV